MIRVYLSSVKGMVRMLAVTNILEGMIMKHVCLLYVNFIICSSVFRCGVCIPAA